MMRPERIDHRSGKGLVVIHCCIQCGYVRANRLAFDTAEPDELDVVTDLLGQTA
jgi:hypothetical protein